MLHYVLMAYVTLQFGWWGWLIYDLNVEILSLEAELTGGEVSRKEIRSKLWMIVGEGSVFFVLLAFGAYYIRRFVLREHRLARQEKNFLLATTHEFNSPIAAVKLNLQTIRRKPVSDDQRTKLVEGALEATARLQSLVGNLLMASRIDAGKYKVHMEPVDVDMLLQRLRIAMMPLAQEAGNDIVIEHKLRGEYMLDISSLEFILSNLLGNAVKYAPGTPIHVRAAEAGKYLEFLVIDQGPGIPVEERESIFRKFYRVGSEETRTKKGTGLGLYLVRELASMQGGSVDVMDGMNETGAQFKLKIPYEKA